ncbi:hypothetical protein W97_03758 [Coniosporium apollinis CBS 100218]|uniref:Uncharacterized protein n=1 Tax=Coniosporium apollinis (strain CBS 100218) TaxID=1168221 RepID=R7YRI8_CONA1|nr:uncharacterized protein W97_03758 [Coniosporium apollinis CBS 100218]EON64525.1 hypothetical protein W97_03758 [Coniosporium apollinis CBS 100218]
MDLDLFNYLLGLKVLVYQPCKRAIAPSYIWTHLKDHYKSHPSAQPPSAIGLAIAALLKQYPLADPEADSFKLPALFAPAILDVPIFKDGLLCPQCPFIGRKQETL